MRRNCVFTLAVASVSILSGMASGQLLDPSGGSNSAESSVLFTGNPRLTLEAPTINLGQVPDTEEVRRTLAFRNEGNAPLIINQVKPGCGCTGADVDKSLLAPGDTAHLNIVYNPHGKQGKQHTAVTIFTNEVGAETKVVNIEAEVLKRIAVEPQITNFMQVRKGEGKTMTVVITARGDAFQPTDIVSSHPNVVNATFSPIEESTIDGKPVKVCSVELTLAPNAPVGRWNPNITFKTGDEKAPSARIDVVIDVTGDLQSTPAAINLRMIKPGDPFQSEFTVTNKAGKPFRLISGKFVHDNANPGTTEAVITMTPVDPANPTAYKVEVNGVAAGQNSTIRGVINLVTDIPDEQEIRLQMFGVVRDPAAIKQPNGAFNQPNGLTPRPVGPVGPVVKPAAPTHEGHDH